VADAEITVHNAGVRVEDVVVQVTVEGATVTWMRVQPPTVAIYPATSARVLLEAAPPRSSDNEARTVPFQIHVQSSVDSRVRGGTGGSIVIRPFHDMTATLSPEHLRSRRTTRSYVLIANNGNVAENVVLSSGSSPGVDVSVPGTVGVAPGARLDVPVVITTPLRWIGVPTARPFAIDIRSEGLTTPSPLRGVVSHLALFPRWAALGCLALATTTALVFALIMALEPLSDDTAAFTRGSTPSESTTISPSTQPTTTRQPTTTKPATRPTVEKPKPKPQASPKEQSAEPKVVSSARAGCKMLKKLTGQVHTEQDLIDSRSDIRDIVDRIVESPTEDDEIVLFYSDSVRDVLTADPDDPLVGEAWSQTMTVALTDLFTACVEADYISR
jgi:hypothetical protein